MKNVNIQLDSSKYEVFVTLGSKTGKKEILLCEDQEPQRLILCKILRQRGFLVKACSSGEEAVDTYDPARFDLVLLDINLPGIDGVEVFKN